jgi:hypothetical protein
MRYVHSLLSAALVGACTVALFSGCAKPPEEELAAARAAFKAAQNAEADKYMVNNYVNLQTAMEKAEGEVEAQKEKSPLSRNFDRSKQLLKNVTELAGQIAAEAPAAKEEMRKQVEKGLVSTKKMVQDTRLEVKKSSRSKEKKEVEKMNSNLDAADAALARAVADFSAGNVPDAYKNLTDAQGQLKRVIDKLSVGGDGGLM